MLERAREISEGVLLERMLRSDYESLAKKDDYLIDELRAELKAMSVPPTPEEWARFESNQELKTAILAKNIRLSLALSALKDSLHVQLPLEN